MRIPTGNRPGQKGIDWTPDMVVKLTALWHERTPDGKSHSTAEIGRRLGCGKDAVIGKARRLGLPPRPSPLAAQRSEVARRIKRDFWLVVCENGLTRVDWLRHLRAQGVKISACASTMDVKYSAVRHKCQSVDAMGSGERVRENQRINDAIRTMWPDERNTLAVIAGQLEITYLGVIARSRRMGLPQRSKSRTPAERAVMAQACRDRWIERKRAEALKNPPVVAAVSTGATPAPIHSDRPYGSGGVCPTVTPDIDAGRDPKHAPVTLTWPEAEDMAIRYGVPNVRTHGPQISLLNTILAARGERPVQIRRSAFAVRAGSDAAFGVGR